MQRMAVTELLALVANGEATILEAGAFLLDTGELFTANGKRTEHGYGGYTNHGCRCQTCAAAKRRASRVTQFKRRRREAADDPWEPLRKRLTAAEVLS